MSNERSWREKMRERSCAMGVATYQITYRPAALSLTSRMLVGVT